MIGRIKSALQGSVERAKRLMAPAVRYLGEAAHRRFVAAGVAMIATHLIGKELNADEIAIGLEIAIGGVAGAWAAPKGAEVSNEQPES